MAARPPADVETSSQDGTRLVGRQWSPDSAAKAEFVLIHGLKDHSGRYGELANVLVDRPVRVTAFDLRGHARSGGERTWARRFTDYGADVEAVLRLVRARRPTSPVILLGHSMGGAIAVRYALDHPGTVDGLVLSAPALRIPEGTPPGAAGFVQFLSVLAPHARIFKPNLPGFSRRPEVLAGMAADPLIDPRPIPARTAAELLGSFRPIFHDAPTLRVPLLVLQGSADRVTHPTGGATLVERAGSPSRRLREVPGAYHDLWHEPEATVLVREVADWVEEVVATLGKTAPAPVVRG